MTDVEPDAANAPLIDEDRFEDLHSLLGEGPEGVDGLIETFVDRMPEVLADLEQAAKEPDLEAVANLAHKIKGEASTLGAQRLSLQAKDIELSARDEDLADPSGSVAALGDTYDETEKALQQR